MSNTQKEKQNDQPNDQQNEQSKPEQGEGKQNDQGWTTGTGGSDDQPPH